MFSIKKNEKLKKSSCFQLKGMTGNKKDKNSNAFAA